MRANDAAHVPRKEPRKYTSEGKCIDSQLLVCLSTHIVAHIALVLVFSTNVTITVIFAWEPLNGILAPRKRTFELPTFRETLLTTQFVPLDVLKAIKST